MLLKKLFFFLHLHNNYFCFVGCSWFLLVLVLVLLHSFTLFPLYLPFDHFFITFIHFLFFFFNFFKFYYFDLVECEESHFNTFTLHLHFMREKFFKEYFISVFVNFLMGLLHSMFRWSLKFFLVLVELHQISRTT